MDQSHRQIGVHVLDDNMAVDKVEFRGERPGDLTERVKTYKTNRINFK